MKSIAVLCNNNVNSVVIYLVKLETPKIRTCNGKTV